MAPLTSTSSCESCINLSQKVIELEQRISTLYQIQGAERELDTILLGKAQTTATSAELADTVHHPAAVSQDPANSQPRLSTCVAGVSATDENCWFQLGARPKALPSPSLRSAPSPPLRPRSRGGQPDAVVQTRRGELCFTPAPRRRGPMARLPGSHSRGPAGASPFEHPRCRGAGVSDGQQSPVAPPLSTLVLGDSIIRNVRMRGALTLSFPGATVVDIVDRIPNILASHPQANRLIIHIGTNDIPKQQSELLKLDLGFINSFDAFWERRHLFGADGLHLNAWRRRLLSANLVFGVQHSRTRPCHYPKPTLPADLSATD
ncbi:unnamed protein product [Oreochromis niloticus]|nr:unnamed protein product [Mustela putorius furo]